MNITIVMLIGAVLGALGGVGIFFEPREPYNVEILLPATLKGILVSLLTALPLGGRSSRWQGAGYVLLYAFSFGPVIFLANGPFKSKDAPYVLPRNTILS